MYAGQIVEQAPVDALFADPQHPYTLGLLGSIPRLDVERERLADHRGHGAQPQRPAHGLPLRAALPVRRRGAATSEPPPLRELGAGHRVACWKAPVELAGSRRERRRHAPVLAGRRPGEAFPDHARPDPPQGGRHGARGGRRELRRSRRGETLALVGESGCGKSTTGRLVLRLIGPDGGPVRFEGQRRSRDLDKQRAAPPAARTCRSSSRTPTPRSNPRMTVGEILAEPLAVHGLRAEARARASACASCSDVVGLLPEHARALSARVLGRPAPAHRHRPRARRQSRADRVRRAGLGARRLDPGADRQPAAGPAAPASASPTCSSPTTSPWCSTSATAWR